MNVLSKQHLLKLLKTQIIEIDFDVKIIIEIILLVYSF